MPQPGPRPCPLCGSLRKRPIAAYARHHLARCTGCGLVHTALVPTTDELQSYYGGYPVHAEVSPITLKRYDELLDRFEGWRTTGRILDVGCGAGHFLQRAALRGWTAHGTEYGGQALAASRAKGIAVIEGPLDPSNYPTGHFDVVCSFEVIEHVPHPAEDLERMVSVLRPGGLLYLTTPNFRCTGRWLSGPDWSVVNYPEHLNYFTPATFKALARRQGLRTAWLRTTGMDLARIRTKAGMDRTARSQVRAGQEEFRERLEGSPALNAAKRMLNGLLTLLGIGDHMKAGFVKRP